MQANERSRPLKPQEYEPYLPTYEEVVSQSGDTQRLPKYLFRHLGRYHPYIRYIRPPQSELDVTSRYMNTIYDEGYVELGVPPLTTPHANTLVNAPAIPRDPGVVPGAQAVVPVAQDANRALDHELRIRRLSAVLLDFMLAVKRAIIDAAGPGTVVDDVEAALPSDGVPPN